MRIQTPQWENRFSTFLPPPRPSLDYGLGIYQPRPPQASAPCFPQKGPSLPHSLQPTVASPGGRGWAWGGRQVEFKACLLHGSSCSVALGNRLGFSGLDFPICYRGMCWEQIRAKLTGRGGRSRQSPLHSSCQSLRKTCPFSASFPAGSGGKIPGRDGQPQCLVLRFL